MEGIPLSQAAGESQGVPLSQAAGAQDQGVPLSQAAQGVPLSQAMGQQPQSYLKSFATGGMASPQTGAGMGGISLPDTSLLPSPVKTVAGAVGTFFDATGNLGQLPKYAIKGAAMMGSTWAQDIDKKIDPTNSLLVSPHFSDISNILYDKAAQATGLDQDGGMLQATGKAALNVAKVLTGLTGDMATNLWTYLAVGLPSELANAYQKIGRVAEANAELKNVLSLHVPFTGIQKTLISGEQGQAAINTFKTVMGERSMADPMIQAGTQSVQKGMAAVGQVLKAFSTNTDSEELNSAVRIHKMVSDGAEANLNNIYINPIKARQLMPEEKAVLSHLPEVTSNSAAGIRQEIVDAVPGKYVSEEQIRAEAAAAIPEIEKKLGVKIAPGREQAVIDTLVDHKNSIARDTEMQAAKGEITPQNAKHVIMEKYSPHVRDPKYIGDPLADKAEAEAGRAIKSQSKVTIGGMYKERGMVGTVQEVNAAIEKKYGIKQLFLEDPVMASATKELRTYKRLNDSRLLDTINKFGLSVNEAPKDYLPIQHKNISSELVFPKDIATKMSYYIGATAPANIQGSIGIIGDALNKSPLGLVNKYERTKVFMSPGMWAKIVGTGNLVRGVVHGLSWADAMAEFKFIAGKLEGIQGGKNLLGAGKYYSAQEMKFLYDKFGFSHAVEAKEGMGITLGKIKEGIISDDPTMVRYAKNAGKAAETVMNAVSVVGSQGEQSVRRMLFNAKIREGFIPEAAADYVSRAMFDFTRRTEVTNFFRVFMPFGSHTVFMAEAAPELLGRSPGTYSMIHNVFPRVMQSVMSDPMHVAAFNQLAPKWAQGQDTIIGPVIYPGTLLANILGAGQSYFHFGSDLEVLKIPGATPPLAALWHVVTGKDAYGKVIPGDEAWNMALKESVMGTIRMPDASAIGGSLASSGLNLAKDLAPNATQLLKDTFGLKEPQFYEPKLVALMKASFSQFFGTTDLMQDAMFKSNAYAKAYGEMAKMAKNELGSLQRSIGLDGPNFRPWVSKYQITSMTNAEIYADTMVKKTDALSAMSAENQKDNLAASAIQNKMPLEKMISVLKTIEKATVDHNLATQMAMQRYLEMSKGAKSPREARIKAGISMTGYQGH